MSKGDSDFTVDYVRVIQELQDSDKKISADLLEHLRMLEKHDADIDRLNDDIHEIKTLLANVATKDDINIVLRDALNSVPGHQVVMWTVVLVIVTGISIFWK
ncbi:MAG: hypothetical protein KGH75_01360 [Rhodospirillales bacterium]|nr:hypothetical protein [Rhodospirillales bacterium]